MDLFDENFSKTKIPLRDMPFMVDYILMDSVAQLLAVDVSRDLLLEKLGTFFVLGRDFEQKRSRWMAANRATNGRRKIGANSRAKVAQVAESFRHLKKREASIAIAEKVNLDPDTIRRYLSEIFPGNKWNT